MWAIVFSLALTAILCGIGLSVVDRLDTKRRLATSERISLSFIVGLTVLYFAVYVVGFYRLDATAMAGLVAGLAALSISGLRQAPLREWSDALARLIGSWSESRGRFLLSLAVAAIAVAGLLQGLAPPNDYDSLLYHLALPKYDIERGFIGVSWQHGLTQAFHPEFTRNLTRLSLVLAGDGAAQILHGIIGVFGALGAATLARRMALSATAAVLAAGIFLATRVVVWQMGTAETDVAAAAFAVIALCAYLAWREADDGKLGILFGLALGAALLTKLYIFLFALCLAPLWLNDVIRGRSSFLTAWIGPLVALAVYLPHGTRTYWLTGNPVYPVLNGLFNPSKPNPLDVDDIRLGTGQGVLDLLLAPWNLSIRPTEYFDGMVLGAPFFLMLLPLVALNARQYRHLGPVLCVAGLYFAGWFWLLGQHVRYLLPIMPILSGLAAGGLVTVWKETRGQVLARATFKAVVVVMVVNQLMFVGIYAAIRLPVSLGLMSAETYHQRTPTLGGAFFDTCNFITKNLEPGERYISLLAPHSYYCPQASAILNTFDDDSRWWLDAQHPPAVSGAEALARMEQAKLRFVVVQSAVEDRTTNAARSPVFSDVDLKGRPFGRVLAGAIPELKPVYEGHRARVYDGRQVIEIIRSRPGL